jgi:hypothetical protein
MKGKLTNFMDHNFSQVILFYVRFDGKNGKISVFMVFIDNR